MPHPKSKPFLLLLTCLMLILCGQLPAQDFGSEKELKSKAEKLFRDDLFQESLPLYSQLLSLYPADPIFNYKYGVCMLYATEDKEKPLTYMAFALNKEDTPDEIYYHIGRAYHLNYRFDEAIRNYEIYKTKAGKKTLTRLDVDRQIEMCRNGKNLFQKVKDIRVIERKEWNEAEYFRGFDLSTIQSKVILKPEELMTSFDKKSKETFTVVNRPGGKEIYFSSYGEDGKFGRDLFRVYLLDNQQWSKPENLGPLVNTPFDEDFPFFTPDGKTLYFSSKGHNSMGGYDVFRCDYVPATGSWSSPINMDFAINTPDDDIQFIADPASDLIWFASRRAVPKGKISVYRVENIPMVPVNSYVHGKVITGLPGKLPITKISITNLSNDVKEPVVKPNPENARYNVKLTNGGKYRFKVEAGGFAPLEQEVQIPELTEDRPLRQEIRLRKESGQDFMEVLTFYADTGDSEDSKIARAEWLKSKARLDVSSMAQIPLASATGLDRRDASSNRNALKENEFKTPERNLSNEELLRIARSDAKEADLYADSLERIASSSLKYASQKLAEFNRLNESILADGKKAEEVPAGPLRNQTMQALAARSASAEHVGRKGQAAWLIYQESSAAATQARKTADKEKAYAEEFDLAMKSGAKDAVEKIIAKAAEDESNPEPSEKKSDVEAQLADLNSQIDRLNTSRLRAENELEEIRMDEENTRAELNSTKDKDRKEQLSSELRDLEAQRKSVEPRLNEYKASLGSYQAKHDRLEAVSDLQATLAEEIYSNDGLLSAPTADASAVSEQLASFEAQQAVAPQPVVASAVSSDSGAQKESMPAAKVERNEPRLDKDAVVEKQVRINQLEALLAEETNAAKADAYEKEKSALQNELAADKVAGNQVLVEQTMASLDHFQSHLDEVEKSGRLTEEQQEFIDVQKDALAAKFEETKKLREQFSEEKDPVRQQELIDAMLRNATDYSTRANALSDRIPALETASQELRDVVAAEEQPEVPSGPVLVQAPDNNSQNVPLPALPSDEKIRSNPIIRQYEPGFTYTSNLSLTEEQVKEVRATPEYAKVSVLLSQARESIVQGRNKAFVVQDYINRGEAKTAESQQLIALASKENNKERRAILNDEAIATDAQGKQLIAEADSIKKIVMVNMKQAGVLKNDAEKVLRTMSPLERDALLAALTKYSAPTGILSTAGAVNPSSGQQEASSSNSVAGNSANKTADSLASSNPTQGSNNSVSAGNENLPNKQAATNNPQATSSEVSGNRSNAPSNGVVGPASSGNAGTVSSAAQGINAAQDEVRVSEEYKAYASLQQQLEFTNKEIERMLRDADSAKVNSAELLKDAEDVSEFADATNDRKARKEAMQKADDLAIQAAEQSVASDSLRELAEENRVYAAILELRADSVLNAAGDAKASRIRETYKQPVQQAGAQLASAQTSASNQQNNALGAPSTQPESQVRNQGSAEFIQSPGSSAQNNALGAPSTQPESQVRNEGSAEFIQSPGSIAQNQDTGANTSLPVTPQRSAEKQPGTTAQQTVPPAASIAQAGNKQSGVRTSEEYKAYASLQKELEFSKKEIDRMLRAADSAKVKSAELLKEAERVAEFADATNDRRAGKEAMRKAEDLATQAAEQSVASDSLNELAEELRVYQAILELRSDSVLNDAGEAMASEIRLAYNNLDQQAGTQPTAGGQEGSGQSLVQINTEDNQQALVAAGQPVVRQRVINQNGEEVEVVPPPPGVDLQAVRKSENYIAYAALKVAEDSIMREVNAKREWAKIREAEANQFFEQSNALLEQAANSKKKERKLLVAEAINIENQGTVLKAQADSVYELANLQESEAKWKASAANLILGKVGSEKAEAIVKTYTGEWSELAPALASSEQPEQGRSGAEGAEENQQTAQTNNRVSSSERNTQTEQQRVQPTRPENVQDQNPRVGADRREGPAPSPVRSSFSTSAGMSGAIPMDPPLPDGLVYKVQIGAFKKPLPAGSFGTISPVAGESRGGDWIRYTAGLFGAFNEASAARQQLNARGFRDAFVVAYCNGTRISVSRAREFERNGIRCDGSPAGTLAGTQGAGITDPVNRNASNETNSATNSTANATIATQPVVVAPGQILPQENIAGVRGLIYTVQVGVYSRQVTAGQLYNITPLYFETTATGKFRYTSGSYNNLNDAGRARDIAVGFGVTDAFVSAYLNGKRIPMEEAAALVQAQGNSVFEKRADMNRMPGQLRTGAAGDNKGAVGEPLAPPRERVAVIGAEAAAKLNRAELMFSVQLGAFKNQVPVEVMTRFLSIRDVTIGSYVDADGLTVFTGGTFGAPSQAEQLRDRLRGNGFSDAFVIALYQGRRIAMEEALKAIR